MTTSFLDHLAARRLTPALWGGTELDITGALTSEDREFIRANKAEIVASLRRLVALGGRCPQHPLAAIQARCIPALPRCVTCLRHVPQRPAGPQ